MGNIKKIIGKIPERIIGGFLSTLGAGPVTSFLFLFYCMIPTQTFNSSLYL